MLKKHLLIVGGTLSLGLGIVGMLLPILPTTPFLLLTAWCYLRGSDRLYQWLMNHRVLGNYLKNYLKYHAITKSAKIALLAALWASLSISVAIIDGTIIRLILALVGIGVSIHLLTLKTLPKATQESSDRKQKNLTADSR